MDSQGFRERVQADWAVPPSRNEIDVEYKRELDSTRVRVAPDNRYTGYGSILEDGRAFTDYKNRCKTRAPPGLQFETKQAIVHGADSWMYTQRERIANQVGQVYGTSATELAPDLYQTCTPEGCTFNKGDPNGVGLERREPVPELFGTFEFPVTSEARPNVEKTALNQERLFGRNTQSRWKVLYQ